MKPSEKAKAVGFKSLQEVVVGSGENKMNLIRWSKDYPRRFELILKGLMFERMSDQIIEAFDEVDFEEVEL